MLASFSVSFLCASGGGDGAQESPARHGTALPVVSSHPWPAGV